MAEPSKPTLSQRFHDCRVYDYFRRIRNAISFAAFPWRSYNRICDILENISGVGCRIEKQTKENPHWLVVVDDQNLGSVVPDSECTPPLGGSKPGQSIERYEGDSSSSSSSSGAASSDPNEGAMQLYKFPNGELMELGETDGRDEMFDVVVRDKTDPRRKVNYVKPSALARPELFDLRDDGTQLLVYVGDDLVGANCAVRINGLSVAFSNPGTIQNGWWPLSRATAVWIDFSAPSGVGDPEQNWPLYGASGSRTPVVATIVARNLAEDTSPTFPDNRAYHSILLWYRQLGSGGGWWNPRSGPWMRAYGCDVTIDMADGDFSGSTVSSLAHNKNGRIGLYGFADASRISWPTLVDLASDEYSLVARLKTTNGATVKYVNANGVVVHTGSGNIRVGTGTYAPTQVTINGQNLTILAKQ